MPDEQRPESPGNTPAARNIEEITHLEREASGQLSRGERISLAITNAAGTFTCVTLHVLGIGLWMGWNSAGLEGWRWDPYPFGLMTMLVSMEGVLLAILILITQNRMSMQTDKRDQLNLQIDLLAEQEMTMVLRMLSRISDRLKIPTESSERDQARQLMEETNIYQLTEDLQRKLE